MSILTKLSLAFVTLIVLALFLSGAAFVALKRDSRAQQTLEHLAAVAPQVTLELRAFQRAGASPEQVGDLIRQAARAQDVRVLLVDRAGTVVEDSGSALRGHTLAIPSPLANRRTLYRTWTGTGVQDERLVYLYVPPFQIGRLPRSASEPFETVVLAVPEATIAGAWRDLLPSLLWAGAIALCISLVAAALLARSLARPLVLLTRASTAMARGQYDQEIPVRRRDEVGRLAQAFNLMAREVGRSHLQMRALFANVSHDLKTPLTSILGFSQALRDRAVEEPDQVVEAATIIHDEAERVQSLVEDLLFLSEIESGQVPLAAEAVDLSALAGRVARRFMPRFEEHGIAFALAPGASLVVSGDASKLQRILDNLLDNAVKYSPHGSEIRMQVSAGDDLAVTIFNSGSTIPTAELPRIFDRFHRLDRARSGAPHGSGLGLAIARELAELHGGTLEATSDARGTTFTLRLPRPEDDPRARRWRDLGAPAPPPARAAEASR